MGKLGTVDVNSVSPYAGFIRHKWHLLLFTIILEKYLVLESHAKYTIVVREKPTWSSRVQINFDNYFNKRFTWTIECNCVIYHVSSNCFIVDQFGHWSVF